MTVLQVRCQWLGATVGAGGMQDPFVPLRARAEPGPALPALPPGLAERRTALQRLAGVRPPIRVRLLLVVRLQVRPQAPLELRHRGEVATPQELPRQHTEPQLDLIQPRAMYRQVMEGVLVPGVAKPRPPLLLGPQLLGAVRQH